MEVSLIYFYIHNSDYPSIQSKVYNQLIAFNDFFDAHVIPVVIKGDLPSFPGINTYIVDLRDVYQSRSIYEYRKVMFYKVYDEIIQIMRNFDFNIVYIRYPLADWYFFYLLKRIKNLKRTYLIIEHNTKEIQELLLQKKFVHVLSELMFKSYLGKFIDLIVSPTFEIGHYEAKFYDLNVESIYVMGNGVNFAESNLSDIRTNNRGIKKELTLCMVATIFEKWHGLDILVNSIDKYYQKHYSQNFKIKLNIAGNIPKFFKFILEKNFVNYFGPLRREQLVQFYKVCDIGISSLALYRKGLKEASPLKSREYAKYGIPFVYSYKDPDIPPNFKCALYIEKIEPYNFVERLVSWHRNLLIEENECFLKLVKFANETLSLEYKVSNLSKYILSKLSIEKC